MLALSQLDPIGNKTWSGAAMAHEPFMGPMPQLARTEPYEGRNVAYWTLPEAYKGRSLFLKDTVKDLLFTDTSSFMLKYIAVPYPTDEISITWTEFEAKAHLMDITPYTTRSHQIKQSRTIRRAQLFRWGIEAEFEGDFLKTALGRVSYLAALRQIVTAAKETLHQQALRSLTLCHRQQNQFLRECTQIKGSELQHMLKMDKERFAIVQKTKNGLEKLDMLISKEMQMYGGDANAYLIPEEIAIHCTIVRPEKTDYYIGGQMAVDRVNGIQSAMPGFAGGTQGNLNAGTIFRIRQFPAYLIKNRAIQGVSEADTQNLARIRQIGNYYVMKVEADDYTDYKTEWLSIKIFDHTINNLVKITAKDVIENLPIFDGTGKIIYDGNAHDFLSTDVKVGNDEKRSVKIVADINPAYITVDSLMKGGRTILNALGLKTLGDVVKESTTVGIFEITANGQRLIQQVKQIIGDIPDEVLAAIIGATIDTRDPKNAIIKPGVVSGTSNLSQVDSKIDAGFLQMLQMQVPVSKREEISSIVTHTTKSTLQKAQEIKEKMIGYVESGIQGTSKLQSKEHVEAWFSERVRQYESKIAEERSQIGTQQKGGGEFCGFALAGTDLSKTPYRFMEIPDKNENVEGNVMGFEKIGMYTKPRQPSDNTALSWNRINAWVTALAPYFASKDVIFGTLVYLMLPINQKSLLACCNHNIMLPMNLVVFQAHQEFLTRGLIKCKENGESIYSFMGNEDFQIAHEAGRKMAMMHFTMHFRCVVHDAKSVHVDPDVFVQQRISGCGTRFWTQSDYINKYKDRSADLHAICVPIEEKKFSSPMSITGRWGNVVTGDSNYVEQSEFDHYSTSVRFSRAWGWNKDANQVGVLPGMSMALTHKNMVVYQGLQRNYNPRTGNHDITILNTGHLSKNLAPGCADVFDGSLDVLDEQNYEK